MSLPTTTESTGPIADQTRVDAPYAEVAPDAWFPDRHATLTYRVPEHLERQLDVGQLIWVPLRKRLVLGVVVERHDRAPKVAPREIDAVVEPAFCLTPLQWRLAIWIAEQTMCSLFESASLMFPPGASDRAVEHLALVGEPAAGQLDELPPLQRRLVELLARDGELSVDTARRALGSSLSGVIPVLEHAGLVTRVARVEHRPAAARRAPLQVRLLADAAPPPARAKKQSQAFAWLSARLRTQPDRALPIDSILGAGESTVDRAALNALAARGCIAIEPVPERPASTAVSARDIRLTAEQRRAWESLHAALSADPPGQVLIHGVTGSGKTELYLRVAADVLARGQSAIVLVPEIALAGQILQRFRERFGERVALLHSALDDWERSRNWERARSGEPLVIVGPRSALFAPLPAVGAIILDEEHEPAYKQDTTPRYHARAVAERLAELHRAALILGSATPDVETTYRSLRPPWTRVTLTERVGQQVAGPDGDLLAAPIPLPQTRIVDMRAELRSGNPSIFSRSLVQVIEARLAAGQQVILFLNRRGASTLVQCRACGDVSRCPYCDIPLVYHRVGDRIVCHRCGHRAPPPATCRVCGTEAISYYGAGSQRVEAEVATRFPRARVLRWDQDALRRGVRHEDLLRKVARQEIDILVGTQMIAKGLDLPGVGAVGIVNADTFLYLPDIRAAERTFQMLTQVAGRASRRTAGGEVIIQTYSPEHYAVSSAAAHDYRAFYREEIAFRRRHGYPPFKRLIRLLYRHADEVEARLEAERVAGLIAGIVERSPAPLDVDLIGPAPAFAARVRGRYGWQLLLRGDAALFVAGNLGLGSGWTIDVDPASLL